MGKVERINSQIYVDNWIGELKLSKPYQTFENELGYKGTINQKNMSIISIHLFFPANLTWYVFRFHLKRHLGNHLLQTFLPSAMITLTSAASVFIPSDMIPGRMGMCVTSFLSLISLFNGSR